MVLLCSSVHLDEISYKVELTNNIQKKNEEVHIKRYETSIEDRETRTVCHETSKIKLITPHASIRAPSF